MNDLQPVSKGAARAPYDLRLQIGRALDCLVCEESTPEQVDTFIKTFRDFGLAVSFAGSPPLSKGEEL